MLLKIFFSSCIFFCCIEISFSQPAPDSSNKSSNVRDTIIKKPGEKLYNAGSGKVLIYYKPKAFDFLTSLPKDAAGIAIAPFRKKNIRPLVMVAASTALLIIVDEPISKTVHQLSKEIHLSPDEQYKDIVNIKLGNKNVSLLKAPKNINTALYQVGQGFPSLLIGAGLLAYGKIHHNFRAISTASQLAESFILMGVSTQFLKRVTGRQSPSEAVNLEGRWNPFPSFKNFQSHTPFYDAFPSGHLATLMSTVTVLTENYPEKKWIKPVGYSIIGLVGFSMINNNVHWASDYPLALGLGYLCAKQVAKKSRRVSPSHSTNKNKAAVSYTINYGNGRLMPGILYKF